MSSAATPPLSRLSSSSDLSVLNILTDVLVWLFQTDLGVFPSWNKFDDTAPDSDPVTGEGGSGTLEVLGLGLNLPSRLQSSTEPDFFCLRLRLASLTRTLSQLGSNGWGSIAG
ncbi:hypothetical protein U1Q18_011301 [Sarracenia purpurea var. burkii]